MEKTSNKKTKSFLKKLLKKCKESETLSLIQLVEELGGDYDKLLEETETNTELNNMFGECHECWDNNLSLALKHNKLVFGNYLRLREEVGNHIHKYRYKTDEKYKKEYDVQKAKEDKIEKRRKRKKFIEKLELQGRELPRTQVQEDMIMEDKIESKKDQNTNLKEKDKDPSHHFTNLIKSQMLLGFFKGWIEVFGGAFGEDSFKNAIFHTLKSLNPQDPVEEMLCSRLLVLHHQYMNFMASITTPEQTTAGIDMNVNRSTKLMRLHNETLEALNRYRRKGEQKVTVQHVNVNSGGQAIVGSEFNNQGGGVDGKK